MPDGKVDQMLRFLEVNMDNPSNIEGPPEIEIEIKDEPIEKMEETVFVVVIGDDEDQELQVTQAAPAVEIYKCEVCDQNFSSMDLLKSHISKVHKATVKITAGQQPKMIVVKDKEDS